MWIWKVCSPVSVLFVLVEHLIWSCCNAANIPRLQPGITRIYQFIKLLVGLFPSHYLPGYFSYNIPLPLHDAVFNQNTTYLFAVAFGKNAAKSSSLQRIF